MKKEVSGKPLDQLQANIEHIEDKLEHNVEYIKKELPKKWEKPSKQKESLKKKSAKKKKLAEKVGKDLNVDVVVSNNLKISNDVVTGEIETNVSIDNKKSIIQDIAQSMSLTMSEVVVVGDHVFDLPPEAGLKIAFNPRHVDAEKAADFVVKGENLMEIFRIIKANAGF